MKFIESCNTDPAYNLALEQYVFDCMPKDETYFMLWQNANTIVIGKHQNTMEEISLPYVKAHDIKVVRRLSGGGAVYHDLGNVNFTFIADAGKLEELNLQMFCLPVIHTLESIGVHAQLCGRNDITIDGRKFSGNSQYIKNGRVMHHGTLMFDSDLSVVEQALKVNADKYESKGFPSVRSRVTNIREHLADDMELEDFKEVLRNSLAGDGRTEPVELTDRDFSEIVRIKKERYDTWDWNYGFSPEYSVRKKRTVPGVGTIELFIKIEDGRIRTVQSCGDYFGDGMTAEMAGLLHGCRLKEEDITEQLVGYPVAASFTGLTAEEFARIAAG